MRLHSALSIRINWEFYVKNVLFGSLLLSLSAWVNAWDGNVTGTVHQVHIVPLEENDRSLRIVMEGNPKMCGTNTDWAYLDESNSNYQVVVSALLAAKMSGSEISIYSNKNPAGDHCEIGYVILR